MASEDTPTPAPDNEPPARRDITVRRAPKFVPFMILGAIVGAIVAAIIAYGRPADPEFDASTVFGFFLVACAAGGVILFSILALVLDRISVRRTRRAVVEAVPDSVPDEGPEHDGGR
ncbi:hypothetical protein ACIQTZ_13390 [Paenarthrobacter sp. NPDC090520]|uniref:hypothetical protein n=1 Tax=Paenarthrobacter sp. NPDC090520 TaxID=3364382 RepID=UPI0038017967